MYVDDLIAGLAELVERDEWPALLNAGSGIATPLADAARLVVEAARSSVDIRFTGGTLPPGENESYALDPQAPRLALRARPLPQAVGTYVDWLRRNPALEGRSGP